MEPKPDLNDLEILCAVVDLGSFRAAADFVGTSQPTVSRAIARLETRLDRPLVRRNSRSVAPTSLGLRYASLARQLLRDFGDVEAELLNTDEMSGPVSVSAPPALGRRLLAPILAGFCAEHPSVRLNVTFENRRVDFVDESVDIAVRFGSLAPTWHRQRLLLRGHLHIYGGAADAELASLPVDEVLVRAPCLLLHSTHLRDRWPFIVAGHRVWRNVKPALTSNDVGSLIEFVRLGMGITLLPDFMVHAEVDRGDLVRLTAPEEVVPTEVFTVTPDEQRCERVEALLDYLVSSSSHTRAQ